MSEKIELWRPQQREYWLAYAAGIVDGEGSIDVQISKPSGSRKNPSYRVRLKVSMCDSEAIDLFIKLFGGYKTLRQRKNPNQRPIFEWVIRSKTAERALIEIIPFLLVKKPRAEIAIELSRRIDRNKMYSKKGFLQTPGEELFERKRLSDSLKLLNTRGPRK